MLIFTLWQEKIWIHNMLCNIKNKQSKTACRILTYGLYFRKKANKIEFETKIKLFSPEVFWNDFILASFLIKKW